MISQGQLIELRKGLNVAAISADTTTVGETIDLTGYDAATISVFCQAWTAGDVTLKIEDRAATTDSWVDVDAKFLDKALTTTKLDATGFKNISYVGGKQYLRLSLVSANSANLTAGVIVVLGEPRKAPIA